MFYAIILNRRFPGVSLFPASFPGNRGDIMNYSHDPPPFLKSTYDIVMWHLCVCFLSTVRQSLGSNQTSLSLCLLRLRKSLNNRAVKHQDNIIGSFCLLVIIGCFLWVALGSILSIEVNVSFCMMAPVPVRARGKEMGYVVRTCWYDITGGMPAERKRHGWSGDGSGSGERVMETQQFELCFKGKRKSLGSW